MAKITAIIHTKNEEKNIARAIDSLQGFADQILVIDMASIDSTVEISRARGAEIVHVEDFGYVEPARKIALQHAIHDWIYICDADEVVTPELCKELLSIAVGDSADIVNIPFRTYMFGKEIVGAGWSRDREYHTRFFKKEFVQFSDKIHSATDYLPNAREIKLPKADDFCVIHFNYSDFEHFVSKMNRYTTIESVSIDVPSVPRFLYRIFREIWQRFVLDKAWKDGYRGVSLVSLMVTYRIVTYSKARLREQYTDEDQIFRFYDSVYEAIAEKPANIS